MESKVGCWRDYVNGVQFQPTWIQSNLSDLEENTKSMLDLIKMKNGDSFAQRAEWYYQKKPELEERVAKYQQLYHLLLNHYSSILPRSSVSSISTHSNIETGSCEKSPEIGSYSDSGYVEDVDQEKSLKIESNPEYCVEDFDQEKVLKAESNPESYVQDSGQEKSPEIGSLSDSNSGSSAEGFDQEKSIKIEFPDSNPKSCGEDSDKEMISIPKLRASSPKSSKISEQSNSKPNETGREDELKNEVNKKSVEQIEELMKEIEFLRNQNFKLLSEKNSSFKEEVYMDRIKKERRPKFCFGRIMRKISIKPLKSSVRKINTEHLKKGLVQIKTKINIKRLKGLINRKKIIVERFKFLVKRMINARQLKLGFVKIKRKSDIKWLKLVVIKRRISSIRRLRLFLEKFLEKFLFFFRLKCNVKKVRKVY